MSINISIISINYQVVSTHASTKVKFKVLFLIYITPYICKLI